MDPPRERPGRAAEEDDVEAAAKRRIGPGSLEKGAAGGGPTDDSHEGD